MAGFRDALRRLFGRSSDPTATRPTNPADDETLNAIEAEVRALVEDGRDDRAKRRLKKAFDRYPVDPAVAALAGDLLFEMGAFGDAVVAFGAAVRLDEADAYSAALLAGCHLEEGDVDDAREALAEAFARDPGNPDGQWWRGVLHDLDGADEKALHCYRRAAKAAPRDYFVPCRQTRRRFQQMSAKAWRALEREFEGFGEALAARNVTVRIQDVPTAEQIADGYNPLWLGVFEGHMGPEISLEDPWSALPAHVILFQRNLERDCRDRAELVAQIRITLLHEAAHAHGREEDWMEDRGLQ
jgi:tetratricopeptide (TPR) repeat protein